MSDQPADDDREKDPEKDREKDPEKAWLYHVLRPIAAGVFKAAFRFKMEGKRNVPKHGPVILVANHRSYLDIPMMGFTTRRQVHFMAKAELWDRPFSRWFCESMGSFPVKRGEPDRSALARSLKVLESGGVLGLFPEGTRQVGPVIQHCHAGVAYLAQKTGAVVVPMAITGTEEAMGVGMSYPKPKKVRVRVGPPIDLVVPGARPASRGAREKAMQYLKDHLQRMFDELRAES